MDHTVAVSFVHGYADLRKDIRNAKFPALWVRSPDGIEVYSYPFPRNVGDFHEYREILVGQMPKDVPDFERLPRFGLTGLSETADHIFAGSWNGVYKIRKADLALEAILTNPLMNDMHGIWADDERVITILTGKDTVVISGSDGLPIDYFTIGNDLTIYKDPGLREVDWRFVSKQFRGATGLWHFNYVQAFGNEIWLTSRNLGTLIIVDMKQRKSYVRTMNHKTPVLLHDGKLHDGGYYFTSIDGKIVIAYEAGSAPFPPRETFSGMEMFSRDLVCDVLRLSETEFGREPNWCRGIACWKDIMYVTVDGRYDTDLSFGVVGVKRSGEMVSQDRIRWAEVGSESDLRYVTGFDLLAY